MDHPPVFKNKVEALNFVGLSSDVLYRLNEVYDVIQRVPSIKKPRSENGRIILFSDGGFWCMSYDTGLKAIFSPKGTKPLNDFDFQAKIKEAKQREISLRKEREKQYSEKAVLAFRFWKQCDLLDVNNIHPYFALKKVDPVSTIRETTAQKFKDFFGFYPKEITDGRILVIPLKHEDRISSLQFITESGEKLFLYKARKKGCYWQSCKFKNPKYIAIGEGVATVLSVIQHSPVDMVGVSAMDAGNLPLVAVVVNRRYPKATMVICGDNDKSKTGQESALEARRKVIGKSSICIPEFTKADFELFKALTKSDKEPSDWNDWYLIQDYLKENKETEKVDGV